MKKIILSLFIVLLFSTFSLAATMDVDCDLNVDGEDLASFINDGDPIDENSLKNMALQFGCMGSEDCGACPAPFWQPKPASGLTWQIQLANCENVDTSFDVEVYDIDLYDTPLSTINELKSQGRTVICYFSAGSYENWRTDAGDFPAVVLGNNLSSWPGERWLDIRRIDLLGPIMQARMDLAVQKGCDAVDPDNVDGYTNNTGFPLTANDQLEYNKWLAEQAHQRGLSIGLKNDLEQAASLVDYFDWAINESCLQYNECDYYQSFLDANKAVFGIEYSQSPDDFCSEMNNKGYYWLYKGYNLEAYPRVGCENY